MTETSPEQTFSSSAALVFSGGLRTFAATVAEMINVVEADILGPMGAKNPPSAGAH